MGSGGTRGAPAEQTFEQVGAMHMQGASWTRRSGSIDGGAAL